MAGQPRWHAFLRKLERLGGFDYVCDQIVAGETIKTIAHGLGVSKPTIYKLVHHSPENEIAFREARRTSADALVEEGQELIDGADPEFPAGVQKAKEQANFRKWRAGVDNREHYGPPQQAAVQINLGADFLGALKELGSPSAAPKELPVPEGEFEEVE